jgi:hypothetical protein
VNLRKSSNPNFYTRLRAELFLPEIALIHVKQAIAALTGTIMISFSHKRFLTCSPSQIGLKKISTKVAKKGQ